MVMGCKVVAIISPESAPIKRMVQEARERNTLIDATFGRKTRSVLIMDNGQIIEEGEPQFFFQNPREERTKLFLSKIIR